MLGKKFLLLFLLMFSSFSKSEVLIIKEHKTYIVPENEQWVIKKINNPCDNICTNDLSFIDNASVKIDNGTINGDFSYSYHSLEEFPEIVIMPGSKFGLGDSVQSLTIEKQEVEY
ncbi:hypothetical protein [Vibrio sp. E150_018]